MTEEGFTITRAIQSRPWPAASANLEYAAVWGARGSIARDVPRTADDVPVRQISTLLEPAGRVEGHPARLIENSGIAFIGCYVLGMGFVVKPEEAQEWIAADPRNAEVLFPYLNGEDLNSRPDASAARWVVDFNTRTEQESASYAIPFQRVQERVRSERNSKPKAVRESPWWQFLRTRPAMRSAIAGLSEVLVIARVSKTVMPLRVNTGQIPSEACVVFATEDFGDQAVLSSSLHQIWAITYGSGMRNDPRYTPSDVFDTFPRPRATDELVKLGRQLDEVRREIMLRRKLGLTRVYNMVNDATLAPSMDEDIALLRQTHIELDRVVVGAFGWDDVDLGHGFHSHRKMERWTVSPEARIELLDRLLEENQHRSMVARTA
ncbi:type IIL restriction-modification enzyme MmeI [Cellulosimicrobium cellulans]|uniref:type IIL restriction-modification enzyme MmeI n=1 Tax=Cellulosimicrobium cellulans TaxID=1710 RepID=UPI002096BFE0|nr:type IIL restriction-modification enzyme MmeI [Cellulosimicrobium cellulans]MCO7271573.1 hypothetical protein [Cellulosimicrobium cellulans]